MSKLTEEFLKHIIDEILFLEKTGNSLNPESFYTNVLYQKAFVRSLEIIGEAIKQVPDSFRQAHLYIDWKSFAGLRDKLIHDYMGVDYEIVWDVIKNELPPLKQKLLIILKKTA